MAKKHKSYPDEPTLDMGFDEMDAASQQETGPVTVLGMTFSNDEERRAYFREQLRAKLPELRNIEGFPIGSDDDIVNLSDPPYYTACPNPWLNDFIAEWEQEKLQLEAEGKRQPNIVVNEPYAADVSEGKNNPVYLAHAYHTKVPYPAIARYILHYTEPGDIVFDGFCGTGMTTVAANACIDFQFVSGLAPDYKNKAGLRHSICSDLAPIATHIAASFNTNFDPKVFKRKAMNCLTKVDEELGWMFNSVHNGKTGRINTVIWSDVFSCASCGGEIVYWDEAVNASKKEITDSFPCPHCGALCSKSNLNKVWETYYDNIIRETATVNKKVPVVLNCSINGKRVEKIPDSSDIELLSKIENIEVSHPRTEALIPDGYNTRQPISSNGVKYTHQFYTKRTFLYFMRLFELVGDDIILRSWLTSALISTTKMNRFRFSGTGVNAGTLFIPSLNWEFSPYNTLKRKIESFVQSFYLGRGNGIIGLSSASNLTQLKDSSIDYIFIDPPFGANIMYSEVSSIWEGWLRVKTNITSEAIVNEKQSKALFDYQQLMSYSFAEFYRVLKPGKWMTIEFSNTSASVWNSIQTSLQNVGFVIANVSALDKKQGSFKAVTTTTAVKQDLIISCFKPTEQLLYKFENEASETNVWDFIDELLSRLPVHLEHSNKTTAVVERSPKILYDRLISFYVQHGFPVPLNAQEFQAGLRERYAERDGMYFTPSQAAKYDELRKRTDGFQASLFFVDSEQGGIAWLNNELSTPQTYQDLQPKWMQAINGVRKGDILPELMQILEENFIKEYDGRWRKPNLQDDVDLAALRHKALMREFKVYVEVAQKPRGKIKEARVEALRAGFKQCYQDKDFATIVAVGDRIPQNLLTEDEQLLQFYEIASSRV